MSVHHLGSFSCIRPTNVVCTSFFGFFFFIWCTKHQNTHVLPVPCGKTQHHAPFDWLDVDLHLSRTSKSTDESNFSQLNTLLTNQLPQLAVKFFYSSTLPMASFLFFVNFPIVKSILLLSAGNCPVTVNSHTSRSTRYHHCCSSTVKQFKSGILASAIVAT